MGYPHHLRSFEEKLQICHSSVVSTNPFEEAANGPVSGPFFYKFGTHSSLFYSKKQYRSCYDRYQAEWKAMDYGFAHLQSALNYLFDYAPGFREDELILVKSCFQIEQWKPFAHIGRNAKAEYITQSGVSNCLANGIGVYMNPVLTWGFIFVGRDQVYVGSFMSEEFQVSDRERNYWDLDVPYIVRPAVASCEILPHADGLVEILGSDDYYENPFLDGVTYTFTNLLPDTFHGDWDGITSEEINSVSPSPHLTQLRVGDWNLFNFRPDFTEVAYFSCMGAVERKSWWEKHQNFYR